MKLPTPVCLIYETTHDLWNYPTPYGTTHCTLQHYIRPRSEAKRSKQDLSSNFTLPPTLYSMKLPTPVYLFYETTPRPMELPTPP